MEILRKYATASTIIFPLGTRDSRDLLAGATIASGDIKIMKDEGAFANTATASFVDEGSGMYSIPLTATELTAARIAIRVVDQTGTKEWEDQIILITTYGNASAQHTDQVGDVFDVDATDHQIQGSFGQAIGDPVADATTIYQAVVTDAAGDNVAIDIVAVKAETAGIIVDTAEIGAAGAGLTAIVWNPAWDAEVQSEVADALNAVFVFTKTGEVDANIQSINDAAVVGDGNATPWDGA